MERYTIVFGSDGVIAIGICHPPFEPRLIFETVEEAEDKFKEFLELIEKYRELKSKQIPKAFREWDDDRLSA